MPGWSWPIIIAGLVGFFLFQAIQAFEGVSKIFGPVGRKIYDRKTRLSAKRAGLQQWELADLRRQVEFLSRAVDELRNRDEMNWAFTLSDTQWHRNYEFFCADKGVIPMPRVSYMEFRDKWLRERTPERLKSDAHEGAPI